MLGCTKIITIDMKYVFKHFVIIVSFISINGCVNKNTVDQVRDLRVNSIAEFSDVVFIRGFFHNRPVVVVSNLEQFPADSSCFKLKEGTTIKTVLYKKTI